MVTVAHAKQAFQELVWPAVAGNVAWSFFTVLIDPPTLSDGDATLTVRAIALLLLALYLVGDWIRTFGNDGSPQYWCFDGAHLTALTVFAIGAATGRQVYWLSWALTCLFGLTALGHATTSFGNKKWWAAIYAVINGAGIPVVWLYSAPDGRQLPIAIAVVLVPWIIARRIQDSRAKRGLDAEIRANDSGRETTRAPGV